MNISNLLNIEIAIAGIYNQLFRIESSNNIESERYIIYIKQLLAMLNKEEEILNNYTIEEIYFIKEELKGKRIDITPTNIFIDNAINRLQKKLDKLLSILITKEIKRKEANDNLKETCILISLVDFEKSDIYLSFIDEKINNTNKFKTKLPLLINKYLLLSELDTDNIIRISKRNFQTEESIYLDSLLYSASYGYSNNIYLKIKNTVALDNIKRINTAIEHNEIKKDNTNMEIILRTMYLLLSKEEYEILVNSLYNNKELLYKYINLFNNNILEILNKDRQRHKTLYLKK